MTWFRRIIAFLLLAAWLPATSHCAIETVMDWANDTHCVAVCSHNEAAESGHPAADACSTLEDGAIKSALDRLLAPAPSLTIFSCLRCVHAALLAEARPVTPPAWADAHPRDWLPIRHIASRAVAPARAPSLLG